MYKWCQITQSNTNQEEIKLASTIIRKNGDHTLMHDKVIKSPFIEKNVATTKRKENSNKDLITRLIGTTEPVLCSSSKMVNFSSLKGSL